SPGVRGPGAAEDAVRLRRFGLGVLGAAAGGRDAGACKARGAPGAGGVDPQDPRARGDGAADGAVAAAGAAGGGAVRGLPEPAAGLLRRRGVGSRLAGRLLQRVYGTGGRADQPLRSHGDDGGGHLLALRARTGVAPGAARGGDSKRPPARAREPAGALSAGGAGGAVRGRGAGVARLSRTGGGIGVALPARPDGGGARVAALSHGRPGAPPSGRPAGVP